MKSLALNITTPDGPVLSVDNLISVTLPTPKGQITILPQHIPLVTQLLAGKLVIRSPQGEESIAIQGGILETDGKIINILADFAINIKEINRHQAEEAKARAEKLILEKKLKGTDFTELEAELKFEFLKLKLSEGVNSYASSRH